MLFEWDTRLYKIDPTDPHLKGRTVLVGNIISTEGDRGGEYASYYYLPSYLVAKYQIDVTKTQSVFYSNKHMQNGSKILADSC